MSIEINIPPIDGKGRVVRIEKNPDACPVCHVRCKPNRQGAVHYNCKMGHATLEIPFTCPSDRCSRLFIAIYTGRENSVGADGTFKLNTLIPSTPRKTEFSAEITKASKLFGFIYNQALEAERHGLDHIRGPGFRKALEFLIKDYLINIKNKPKDEVEKATLGGCIKDYLAHTNIAECAERAAWIGNDETHYIRKWVDKDVSDLKNLILLTTSWIVSEMRTQQYKQDMKKNP